jgi:hypothetical protein
MAKKNTILKGVLFIIFVTITALTLQLARAETLTASSALYQATNSASLRELKVVDQLNTGMLLAKDLKGLGLHDGLGNADLRLKSKWNL